MEVLDKKYLVTQSNMLLEKKRFLNLNEQKVILIFASLISPEDVEFKKYEVKANEIMDLLEVKNRSKYIELKETIYSLADKSIKIEKKNNKGYTVIQWFSYADYEDGVITVKFTEELKPYLLELNEYFTKYKLENVLSLKSKYSIQMYELLKCNAFKKEFDITIDELRGFLNAEDKYKEYKYFKRYCILKAQEEINEKTDITFEFEEMKKGRKVDKVKFKISKNIKNQKQLTENANEPEIQNDTDEVTQADIIMLKKVFKIDELTDADILAILNTANGDVAQVIEKYYSVKNKPDITNFVGFMIKAIKENYSEVSVTQETKPLKTKFHNFDQRTSEYTPEELERHLLERQKKKFNTK